MADRPGLCLDPAVAATADVRTATTAEVEALLAAISHHDPDHNPVAHARLWLSIQAASCDAAV